MARYIRVNPEIEMMPVRAASGKLVTSALIMLGLALGSARAYATGLPITDNGNLAISNVEGLVVGITTVPLCISWGGGSNCASFTGAQMSVSGQSNLFSIATSAVDHMRDLGSTPLLDFMTVLGAGALAGQTIQFDATSIPTSPVTVGNCASNAPLNTCTPAHSPFTFTEDLTGTQVTIAFDVLLNAYTGSSASGFTPYKARFSTNLSGSIDGFGACAGTVANIVNLLACQAAGGFIQATWSATASPGAPPPPPAVPPSITCSATPKSLSPPNGNAVAVIVSGLVTQGTNPIAAGGTTYAVTDEYGQVQPSGSFTTSAGGAYSFAVPLIAARKGDDQDGRKYTIVVQAADTTDTTGSCSAVVTVPHDQNH
jgi:hypothetical protein